MSTIVTLLKNNGVESAEAFVNTVTVEKATEFVNTATVLEAVDFIKGTTKAAAFLNEFSDIKIPAMFVKKAEGYNAANFVEAYTDLSGSVDGGSSMVVEFINSVTVDEAAEFVKGTSKASNFLQAKDSNLIFESEEILVQVELATAQFVKNAGGSIAARFLLDVDVADAVNFVILNVKVVAGQINYNRAAAFVRTDPSVAARFLNDLGPLNATAFINNFNNTTVAAKFFKLTKPFLENDIAVEFINSLGATQAGSFINQMELGAQEENFEVGSISALFVMKAPNAISMAQSLANDARDVGNLLANVYNQRAQTISPGIHQLSATNYLIKKL